MKNKLSETYENRNKKLSKTNHKDYKTYLSSDQWKKLRNDFINWLCPKDRCCIVCKSSIGLNVHHRSYSNVTNENYRHVFVLLCKEHHQQLHDLHKQFPEKGLREVTGIFLGKKISKEWLKVKKRARRRRQMLGNVKHWTILISRNHKNSETLKKKVEQAKKEYFL